MNAQKSKGKIGLLSRFLVGSLPYFILSILMMGLSALCDMISPQIIRVTVDHILGNSAEEPGRVAAALIRRFGGAVYLRAHLYIPALLLLLVAVFKVLGQYFFRITNAKAGQTLVKNMRDMLFSHIERLPFSFHMKHQTGDLIQRCTSDIDETQRFVTEQMTGIFRIVILLTLSVVFMSGMSLPMTLIALSPTPLIIFYSLRFHKKIGEGFLACDENEGKLSALVQENLTGVRVVRAFGRERYERDRFDAQNEHYTNLWIKMGRNMSRFWSISDILSGTQILLVVTLGAVFAVRGTLTAGDYIAFVSYNSMMIWPIRQLGRMLSELSKAGVSLTRIQEIMNAEPETDEPGAIDWPMNGDIEFSHVSFAYEGAKEVLHDISFRAEAGTTVGILGGTGSGKSTLMLLLDKLYPLTEGRITVGGRDIREIRTECLRNGIGFVLQEPFLFSRTLAENITMREKENDLPLDFLERATRDAALSETIESFPSGYETFVGERGVTLSGGQKQRVAIARVLTTPTPILIFDDSLSAVDAETDARIRTALEKRFKTATVFLISHRITTLQKANLILVLDHGRIAESGTHEELSCAGGIYERIYRTQSDNKEVDA
ncbi:MAG: ABC transporter ATP-binding protein/permease [Clostridia bacterium]|nr:ABC transporter ATP-binding protein/permease [Clostridia bacterium]